MILSIDTFSDVLGICLLDENKNIKFCVEYRQYKPFSETIIYELDLLLKKFEIPKKEIASVVINKGPGGYTGLRVGITTAKVLAYALNIPLYAYTSLDAMYYSYKNCNAKILTAINAGKNEAYIKTFENNKYSDILLVKQDELIKYIENYNVCIVKNLKNFENCIQIKGSLAINGALLAIQEGLIENPFQLEPIYLRAS